MRTKIFTIPRCIVYYKAILLPAIYMPHPLIFVKSMWKPGNGDMEIITILGKLQIFWGTESRLILYERFQRLADKKWTKLKNLLSRVYYLYGDYELRIIVTCNSSTAKFHGEESENDPPFSDQNSHSRL